MTTVTDIKVEDLTRKPWLTVDEVAAWFDVSPATVRDWRARGTGPVGVRLGRNVRYRLAELEEWAASREAEERRARTGDTDGPDLAAIEPPRATAARNNGGTDRPNLAAIAPARRREQGVREPY